MPWGLGNIAKGIKVLSKSSKVLDGKASKSVDSVSGSTKGAKGTGNTRPSWRQSEIDVEKDFPEYGAQKSFKEWI